MVAASLPAAQNHKEHWLFSSSVLIDDCYIQYCTYSDRPATAKPFLQWQKSIGRLLSHLGDTKKESTNDNQLPTVLTTGSDDSTISKSDAPTGMIYLPRKSPTERESVEAFFCASSDACLER